MFQKRQAKYNYARHCMGARKYSTGENLFKTVSVDATKKYFFDPNTAARNCGVLGML
jgi:hypothetical protein